MACIIPLSKLLKIPSPDSKDNIKPSHVERSNFISPSKLFKLSLANFSAAPLEFSNSEVYNFKTSAPSKVTVPKSSVKFKSSLVAGFKSETNTSLVEPKTVSQLFAAFLPNI